MTQPNITPSFAAITKQAYPVRDVYNQLKVELAQNFGYMKEKLTDKNDFLDSLIKKLSSDDKTSRIYRTRINTGELAHLAERARTLQTACAIIEDSFIERDENFTRTISPEIDNTYILLNPTQDMAEGVLKASTYYNLISNESYARHTAKLNPSALRRELQPQHTEAPKHAAPANDTPERELGPVEIAPGFEQGPQA